MKICAGWMAAAGFAAGLALGGRAELPRAVAQETESDAAVSKSEAGAGAPERGPVWQVVAAEANVGAAGAKYVLYNNRSGESYALHNNNDRWMPLPFVEGDTGAVADSARVNLRRYSRQGPIFLPFSAVLDAMKAEAAERPRKKEANKAAQER